MKKLMKIIIGIAIVFILAIIAVFYFTSGMVDTAGEFFAAIKKQDITAAHSFLSEDFKAKTDETALKEFLTKGSLLKFKDANWSNRQISGGRGDLEGEVITETGGVVPLKLLFVKENGAWKIYGIQKPAAGLQTEQTSQNIPAKVDQETLVKHSMRDFGVSVNRKDMTHFHSIVSKLWQQQFTPEKFNEAFGSMFDKGLDFTVLEDFEPIVEPVTELGDNGELILKGYFPTQPNQVDFEQKYIYERPDWKLIGFHVNVAMKEMAQVDEQRPQKANLLSTENGGQVVFCSSQYNQTSWGADNLIDGELGRKHGYASRNTEPAEIVFSLPKIKTITQFCFNPYTTESSTTWAKFVRVEVSSQSPEKDFEPVGEFTLHNRLSDQKQPSSAEQCFDISPVQARYIRLHLLSNHGGNYIEMGEFMAYAASK